MLKAILDNEVEGDPLEIPNNDHIPTVVVHNSVPIEIEPGKTLNINANLDNQQREKLIHILRRYK